METTKVLRHHDSVQGVAFDPAGARVVTGGAERTVRVWKVPTRTVEKLLEVTATITAVAFHPTVRRIAVGHANGAIAVYDLDDAQWLWQTNRHNAVTSVAFDSRGKRLVSTSSQTLGGATVHDAQTGAFQPLFRTVGMGGIAFDPAGNVMATGGSDGSLVLWAAGYPLREMARYVLEKAITCVDISPDGRQVACGLSNGTVQLRAVTDGADEGRVTMTHPIRDVAYSLVTGLLASCAKDTVQLWNLNNQRAMLDFKYDGTVNALAFAPAGNVLASASADGTVQLTSLSGTINP